MSDVRQTSVVVIAAHPDDEVLGVGGTIQKHIQIGRSVTVIYVTDGFYEDADDDRILSKRKNATDAMNILGVTDIIFLGFKGLRLDTYEKCLLNSALTNAFKKIKPRIVYTHHWGDVNFDHEVVFDMTIVASRPHRGMTIDALYTYETLSSTEWAAPNRDSSFLPNTFEVLDDEAVGLKVAAMEQYVTEIFDYPHPRSSEGIRVLAQQRGLMISEKYAEAFHLVRSVNK
jgi:N-acetylglucosamine malate deacetylase 1